MSDKCDEYDFSHPALEYNPCLTDKDELLRSMSRTLRTFTEKHCEREILLGRVTDLLRTYLLKHKFRDIGIEEAAILLGLDPRELCPRGKGDIGGIIARS